MSPQIRPRSPVAPEIEHELDERRAMIRAARIATGRANPPVPEPRPPSDATACEQAIRVATSWMYLAPFLFVAPFLWSPPFWIAALTQLPERNPRAGSP